MAIYRLHHFSDPQVLRSIAVDRLLDFLEPHREFFEEKGLKLPSNVDQAGELDFDQLSLILMVPDPRMPVELMDALVLVDEMSTHAAMDSLLQAAEIRAMDVGEKPTPADVALMVWLADPTVIERKHAEQYLLRARTFEYFAPKEERAQLINLDLEEVAELATREIDDFFERKKRGRNSRIFVFQRLGEIWFLIRHGEPYRREESMLDASVTSVCYRPIKYDVAVFDYEHSHLRINARLLGEKNLYRVIIGKYFFNQTEGFCAEPDKYTLEPLRMYGAGALSCADFEELESVTLTELEMVWSGTPPLHETLKATNLFRALMIRERLLPPLVGLARAKFQVKFLESETPRSVTINVPSRAEYARDGDALLIEKWLMARGFIVTKPQNGNGRSTIQELLDSL